MLTQKLSIKERQSGKTTKLKQKAMDLYKSYNTVLYITHNLRESKEIKSHFNKQYMNIEVIASNQFNRRYIMKDRREKPPEYKILGNNDVYIIMDEYKLFDKDVFFMIIEELQNSKESYHLEGLSSEY